MGYVLLESNYDCNVSLFYDIDRDIFMVRASACISEDPGQYNYCYGFRHFKYFKSAFKFYDKLSFLPKIYLCRNKYKYFKKGCC